MKKSLGIKAPPSRAARDGRKNTHNRRRQCLSEIPRLREQLARYRALLDSVPGSVALIDLTPKYLFVNKHFLTLTGLTEDQVIGHGVEVIQPFIDPASFAVMVNAVDTAMRGQKTTEVEIHGTDGKGIQRWLVQVAKPRYDGRKRLAGAEILTIDITQQKCAEEQMATYHQKLQLLVDERTAKLRKAEKGFDFVLRFLCSSAYLRLSKLLP